MLKTVGRKKPVHNKKYRAMEANNNKKLLDRLHMEYLKTFQKIYTIKIDSIPYKSDFVIVKENKNSRIGFETYVGTNNLAEGKHILIYSRYKHPDTDSIITIREIPFWYYKD